jgi:TIR domain
MHFMKKYSSQPIEIFCCYAREDQNLLESLQKHKMFLQRQGQITLWSDTNLNAGTEWEKELHLHLKSADIILLLISPDFIASDYCYSTEMELAIKLHNQGDTQVVPIILRPTVWQDAPFAKLWIVPTNAKPATTWSNLDDAFHDVAKHISKIVAECQTRRADRQTHTLPYIEKTCWFCHGMGYTWGDSMATLKKKFGCSKCKETGKLRLPLGYREEETWLRTKRFVVCLSCGKKNTYSSYGGNPLQEECSYCGISLFR